MPSPSAGEEGGWGEDERRGGQRRGEEEIRLDSTRISTAETKVKRLTNTAVNSQPIYRDDAVSVADHAYFLVKNALAQEVAANVNPAHIPALGVVNQDIIIAKTCSKTCSTSSRGGVTSLANICQHVAKGVEPPVLVPIADEVARLVQLAALCQDLTKLQSHRGHHGHPLCVNWLKPKLGHRASLAGVAGPGYPDL